MAAPRPVTPFIWGGAALWAAAVSALKLLQHASLQTQAYDLGVFANLLWNTLHGRWFFIGFRGVNHLGDHFSPLLILLAPIFWLCENAAALLVVQSLALAAALPAVHALTRRLTGREDAGLLAVLWLACLPLFHRVSRYDFHETAFVIPLVLWAMTAWEAGRRRTFWGLAAALLLLREDGGLLLAGWGAAWALFPGDRRRAGAWMIAGGLAWTLLVTAWVMPLFSHARVSPLGYSYGHLGATLPEILRSLATPAVLGRLAADPGRWRTVAEVLLWTGGLPLLAPRWIPAWGLPLALQLVSGQESQSRLQAHYAATVLPFLALASAAGLKTLLERPWSRHRPARAGRWMAAAAVLAVLAGVSCSPPYYRPVDPARRAAVRALAAVPRDASVQAQANLLPHLCLRRDIYLVPDARRAEWVALDQTPVGFFPPPDQAQAIARFAADHAANRVFQGGGVALYRFPREAD